MPAAPPAAAAGLLADLLDLPGAPESRLTEEQAAALPAHTPAPPWRCRVQAVLWWHRAPHSSAPPDSRRYVVGAAVRYLDSPVGPYEELIGARVDPRAPLTVHIPFIAVDLPASVAGGRQHWALPKALAAFSSPHGGAGARGVVVAGSHWRVAVTPVARGPRLPFAGLVHGEQVEAAGRPVRSTSTAYGRARLASVTVQVGSDLAGEQGSIAGWLRSGRHPGLVLDARLRVAAAAGGTARRDDRTSGAGR